MEGQRGGGVSSRVWAYVFALSVVALIYALVVNAWVVDDAYITFRTIDNFVNGYGLRWNVDERVQVFTHPLWLMVMSGVYFVTREAFFSSIAVSFLLSLGTVLLCAYFVTGGFRRDLWKAPLLVVGLLASKAVVDYSSSGLENALSHLIIAVFLVGFLGDTKENERSLPRLRRTLLLASLGFLNRPDLLVLFAPALLYLLVQTAKEEAPGRIVATVLLCTLPATLWVGFSLLYYGFPFPNTAYAKSISPEFPIDWKIKRGLAYTRASLREDVAAYVLLVGACALAIWQGAPRARLVLGGVVLYVGFVVVTGAAATHMGGRFFSVVLFASIVLFVHLLRERRAAAVLAGVLVVYIAWSPVSAFKLGTSAYRPYAQNPSYIDTKFFVYREGAALLNWQPGKAMPDHDWYHYGETLAEEPQRVYVGGARGGEAIGYTAFAAGPDKHFIDRVALSDPFLSKLPAYRPAEYAEWKSGHFHRPLPGGYVESVTSGTNEFEDPDLGRFYGIVANVTRGTVFRRDRLADIWNINLGRYRSLTGGYSPQSGSVSP